MRHALCILLILWGCQCYAQKRSTLPVRDLSLPHWPHTILKTNPFAILWGPIPFTAEYRVVTEYTTGPNTSMEFGASYLGKSYILTLIENEARQQTNSGSQVPINEPRITMNGMRIQFGWRHYLGTQSLWRSRGCYAPHGWYISPRFSFSSARASTKWQSKYDYYLRANFTNVSLLLGRQRFTKGGLGYDVFFGMGYKQNRLYEYRGSFNYRDITNEELPELYTNHVKVTLGINFIFGL